MTERLHFHFPLSCIGEGNGNPLHCSCLENPRDVVAWWAAIYRVAQSQTRLKWLSRSSSSSIYTQRNIQFSSVQSLSHVQLFATPWIAACQASLSVTNSWSSLKPTSIKSVMPSSHLILCHPLFLLPSIPPSIRVFSNESTLHLLFSHKKEQLWVSSSEVDEPRAYYTQWSKSEKEITYTNACFKATLSICPTLSVPAVSTRLLSMTVSLFLPCK